MERPFKTLNWLSALDHAGKDWRPDFLPDGEIRRSVRIRTNATVDDNRLEEDPQRAEPAINPRIEITPQVCQSAFDEARKLYPDALYEELSEVAAKQLDISGRRLRKFVPNPFR